MTFLVKCSVINNLPVCVTKFTVTAQEGPGIVIVHPAGQDVELLCTVMTSNDNEQIAWLIK